MYRLLGYVLEYLKPYKFCGAGTRSKQL